MYSLWKDKKMTKIIMITKPEEMCIGQMYMFKEYPFEQKLKRGICKAICEKSATFRSTKQFESDTIVRFIYETYPKNVNNFIAEYNARIFYKYSKLLEQQEAERNKILQGDFVFVEEVQKKKWYKRLFK